MNNELFGLLGSIFVLISFLINDIKKVRIINIIGALLFVIYGILINAFSTWFLNGALILIHLYYLFIKRK